MFCSLSASELNISNLQLSHIVISEGNLGYPKGLEPDDHQTIVRWWFMLHIGKGQMALEVLSAKSPLIIEILCFVVFLMQMANT